MIIIIILNKKKRIFGNFLFDPTYWLVILKMYSASTQLFIEAQHDCYKRHLRFIRALLSIIVGVLIHLKRNLHATRYHSIILGPKLKANYKAIHLLIQDRGLKKRVGYLTIEYGEVKEY